MIIPFRTSYVDGDESVMVVDCVPKEIRFNVKSRGITIVCEDQKYPLESIDQMSWQAIKSHVEENNGTWTNKQEGIEFLVGV